MCRINGQGLVPRSWRRRGSLAVENSGCSRRRLTGPRPRATAPPRFRQRDECGCRSAGAWAAADAGDVWFLLFRSAYKANGPAARGRRVRLVVWVGSFVRLEKLSVHQVLDPNAIFLRAENHDGSLFSDTYAFQSSSVSMSVRMRSTWMRKACFLAWARVCAST